MPLWGVHWLVVLAICLPLRLDAGVSYLAANVSMPLVAPFITFAELEIGARALHGAWLQVTVEEVRTLKLGNVVSEMVCGTAILATSAAIVGGATTFALASYRRRGRREP